MDLLIKGIELVTEKLLGKHDPKVVLQAVGIEILKHFLKKYEKDLSKEDFLKILELLSKFQHDNN